LSFGIETESGFAGVTWSPDPNVKYTIKPKLNFYVSVATYTSDTLADITEISATSANVPSSIFDSAGNATVVYKSNGEWAVTTGKPTTLHLALVQEALISYQNGDEW
jgi:hypothetical protein